MQLKLYNAIREIMEYDITAILCHCRTHSGLYQLFYLLYNFAIVFVQHYFFFRRKHHRFLANQKIHYGSKERCFKFFPAAYFIFGYGNKIAFTPSIANSSIASGETPASSTLVKNAVPDSITVVSGRNFNVSGLGVVSVCINIIVPLFYYILIDLSSPLRQASACVY
jgi:hypothetical protein